MKSQAKKRILIWWAIGILIILVSASATIGFLTYTNEHSSFAHALQRVNDRLYDELETNAALSVTSAETSEDMSLVSAWYTTGEWPPYDVRQQQLANVQAGTIKMISQLEDYCKEAALDNIATELRTANESLRFFTNQKKLLVELEELLRNSTKKGCDDEYATAGILTFYIDAIAAESHQLEIYDSEYTNPAAIEALGSFARRYKADTDVPYINEVYDLVGKERFSRYFTAAANLYSAVYAYAHEKDESKFQEGYDNIEKLQSDLQSDATVFYMSLSQAMTKVSTRSLERSIELHALLNAGAEATHQDTHFNSSVTTTYALLNAISDYSLNRSTLPQANSAAELAKDDLYIRLRNIPNLVYNDIKYKSGGSTATLTLTLGDNTYDFVFVADEPIAPSTDESKPV